MGGSSYRAGSSTRIKDVKTFADFRKDNGAAIVKVCREFVMLCCKTPSSSPTSPRFRKRDSANWGER
jgi:hypothetical protein